MEKSIKVIDDVTQQGVNIRSGEYEILAAPQDADKANQIEYQVTPAKLTMSRGGRQVVTIIKKKSSSSGRLPGLGAGASGAGSLDMAAGTGTGSGGGLPGMAGVKFRINTASIMSVVMQDINDFERIGQNTNQVRLVIDQREPPRVFVNYDYMQQGTESFYRLIQEIKNLLQ